jgi:YesN/AraC family two-component response regulator
MLKLLIVDDQKKVIDSICRSVKWDIFGIEIIGGAVNG